MAGILIFALFMFMAYWYFEQSAKLEIGRAAISSITHTG
jgi:hypothetical protein